MATTLLRLTAFAVVLSSACDAQPATLRVDVNLVLVPTTDAMSGAEIELSPDQHPGADVRTQDHKLVVTVDQPRMYSLVANSGVSSGALTLKALAPGLNVYAFTFISCAVA